MALCIMVKHHHPDLICSNVPEVLRFVQIKANKLNKLCCHVLFRENSLSPGKASKQAILVESFSNFTVVNF